MVLRGELSAGARDGVGDGVLGARYPAWGALDWGHALERGPEGEEAIACGGTPCGRVLEPRLGGGIVRFDEGNWVAPSREGWKEARGGDDHSEGDDHDRHLEVIYGDHMARLYPAGLNGLNGEGSDGVRPRHVEEAT